MSMIGNSQWLGLGAFTARAQVQSLVRELRSQNPHGVAKKTTKQNKQTKNQNTYTHTHNK